MEVHVVRCGQCKHWDTESLHCFNPCGMCWPGETAAKEGFCYFGEPREEVEAIAAEQKK